MNNNELSRIMQRIKDMESKGANTNQFTDELFKALKTKEPEPVIRYEACTVVTVKYKYANRLKPETFLVRDLLISNDEFDPDQITQHAVAHMNTRINKAYDKGNLQLIILDEDYKFVRVVVIPTDDIERIEMVPGHGRAGRVRPGKGPVPGGTGGGGADGQRHSDTDEWYNESDTKHNPDPFGMNGLMDEIIAEAKPI